MVKVGNFSVELVGAYTKEGFREHVGPAPDNHVYAEVEPCLEYFVCLATSIPGVRADIKVDGVHLGYYHYFMSPHSRNAGRWERKGGKETMRALRFYEARGKRDGGPARTGRVEVSFWRLGELGFTRVYDWSSTDLAGRPSPGGSKCVLSTNGTAASDCWKGTKPMREKWVPHYEKGDHLSTITLHYCTTTGLILNNIIDPPQRRARPRTPLRKRYRTRAREARAVTPEEKKARLSGDDSSGGDSSDGEVTPCQLVDLVDLTGDDD